MHHLIYLLLKQRLGTVAELKEIDWYMGQYDVEDEEEVMYDAPAAYIEFPPAGTKSVGQMIQTSDLNFNIHLATLNFSDSDNRFEQSALSHFLTVTKVYKAIHGHGAKLSNLETFADLKDTDSDVQVYNSTNRIGIVPSHTRTRFMVTILNFSTKAFDFTAAKSFTSINAQLELLLTLPSQL